MYGHEFLLVFDDRLRPILFQNYFSGRDPLFYIGINNRYSTVTKFLYQTDNRGMKNGSIQGWAN